MTLNLHQAAALLDTTVGVVQRWAQKGTIPSITQNGKICFNEYAVRAWAKRRQISTKAANLPHQSQNEATSLLDAVRNGNVLYGLTGKDKNAVFADMVEKTALSIDCFADISETNKKQLLDQLLERELLASTGIGNGIAIPHPRQPLQGIVSEPTIVTCFPETEIQYDAVDGQPVFVIFLILSPNTGSHLQILSKLSYLLHQPGFVDFLRTQPTIESLFERISDVEQQSSTDVAK